MAKRKIKKLIVHCTDSPDDLDIGFQEIDQWHKERGWGSPSGVHCGYHYIIRRDGRVERGRPDHERGAHARGHNTSSLGIVWVGRKVITPEQYKTMLSLLSGLRHQYKVDIENVLGHCEVNHLKTCPNIDPVKLRGNLLFKRHDDPEVSHDICTIKEATRADWS